MKKFLVLCLAGLLLFLGGSYLYYYQGVYLKFGDPPTTTFVRNEGKTIYLETNGSYAPFEIRGVDLGAGLPGYFATEYGIQKSDYLRWFRQIQDMGANTIRVYTILHDDFYNAFYEYNQNNAHPLYLIHGLWVNDYIQNSHRDAYDPQMLGTMLEDARMLVDVLHGNRKMLLGRQTGSGSYGKDISPWVLGYILGVEWEDATVAYTNDLQTDKASYQGRYLYTTADATPFEALLAQLGDHIIDYETKRYDVQRLVAFSNWPTTDPFTYSPAVATFFLKIAQVDVEHIKTTAEFISGVFASYHIYPYYPDYLHYEKDVTLLTNADGTPNSYLTYLKMINDHHTIPVIISEFGVPSSRGMAQRDVNTGRNQGGLSETEQGEALAQCYRDIKASGCAGSIIFTWQDEWFKRTWNTMHAVDLLKTAYWSDYQTNEQYFGLLSFDPGEEESICYVDGDFSDWAADEPAAQNDGLRLYAKYDAKFIYFLIRCDDFDPTAPLYLPLDITPKTGASACQNYGLQFDRAADFVVAINGRDQSRVVVQERYDVLRAMYSHEIDGTDAYEHPPTADSPIFSPISLLLQTSTLVSRENIGDLQTDLLQAETYETGLLTYGNANPQSQDFNSLADFCFGADGVEIKLPWQLLNFSNPSEMTIHDDYYLHYGVENLKINTIYLGAAAGESAGEVIPLSPLSLKGWGHKPAYHERLKASYYAMQRLWNPEGGSAHGN